MPKNLGSGCRVHFYAIWENKIMMCRIKVVCINSLETPLYFFKKNLFFSFAEKKNFCCEA